MKKNWMYEAGSAQKGKCLICRTLKIHHSTFTHYGTEEMDRKTNRKETWRDTVSY
jgi:hypothetical protein